MMQLSFTTIGDHSHALELVAKQPGIIRIRQVFPDHEDPELVGMCVADIDENNLATISLFLASNPQTYKDVELSSKRTAPRPPRK